VCLIVPFCTQNTLQISWAWPQVIQYSYEASAAEAAAGFAAVWDSGRARVKEVGLQAVIAAHAEQTKKMGTMAEPKIGRPLEVTGPSKRPRIRRRPIVRTCMRLALLAFNSCGLPTAVERSAVPRRVQVRRGHYPPNPDLVADTPLLRRLIPVLTPGIVVMPDRAASSSSRHPS
jgi:hypothetical protein